MGNNLATGNKKPKKMDRKTKSAQLPPLPKMYQMGIDKGRELERERIVQVLDKWLGDNAESLDSSYIEIWTPNFIEHFKQLIEPKK